MTAFPRIIILLIICILVNIGIVTVLFIDTLLVFSITARIILLILYFITIFIIVSWISLVLLRFRSLSLLFQRLESISKHDAPLQEPYLQTFLNQLRQQHTKSASIQLFGCCFQTRQHRIIQPLDSICVEQVNHVLEQQQQQQQSLNTQCSMILLPDLYSLFQCLENLVLNRIRILRNSADTLSMNLKKESDSQDKNNLIRYLFHEIRVPLNAVCLSLSEIHKSSALGSKWSESEMELMKIGIDQTDAVARILNDVISLRKIDDGGLRLEHTPFSLEGLIAATIKSFQVALNEHQLTLHCNLQSIPEFAFGFVHLSRVDQHTLPRIDVIGDLYRIRQVLNNLLSNAIKFTPKRGTIRLILQLDPTPPSTVRATQQMIRDTSIDLSASVQPISAPSDDKPFKIDGYADQVQRHIYHDAQPTDHLQTPFQAICRTLTDALPVHSRRPSLTEQLESKFANAEDLIHRINQSVVMLHSDTLAHSFVSVTISVIDSGYGVPKKMQDRLFQPYMQVLAGEMQSGKGAGLGLNISKSLIELHGGRIWYRDVLPCGSEFSFQLHLPLQHRSLRSCSVAGRNLPPRIDDTTPIASSNESTQQPPTPAIATATPFVFPEPLSALHESSRLSLQTHTTPASRCRALQGISDLDSDDQCDSDIDEPPSVPEKQQQQQQSRTIHSLNLLQQLALPSSNHTQIKPSPTTPERNNNSHYRILVAEDSSPNRKLLMMMLRRLKYQVHGVENGQEVVDIFARALEQRLPLPFDLILMDGCMPIKSGIEATTELIALGITIPIIAVTGNALTEDISMFLAAGAKDLIAKPIKEKQLIQRLNQFLHT